MRHHNFIQKKVLGYINDFYSEKVESNLDQAKKDEWFDFLDNITNFDTYDNYIDQLVKDNDKIVILQYFYSHVDEDGNISVLKKVSERNVWIKDNMKYYKDIEKLMKPYFENEAESEDK